MAPIPPIIINTPMTIGSASVAHTTFANKITAMTMLNAPRMPEPQPAPTKAITTPTKPIIKARHAIKMIKVVPTRTVA